MKRPLRTSIMMAALSCAALASASPPLAAIGKHKSLFANTPPSATPVDPQTLRCDTLNKGIAPHIETMKELRAQIDRERQTPSNLKSLFGGRPDTSDAESKLAKERRTTEEIAAMLPAYKCPPYDIEAELKKPMVPKPDADKKSHKGKIF